MNNRNGILSGLALLVMLALSSGCNRSGREVIPVSFNDGWMFIRQDSANIDKILPGIIPNHKWEEVTLPHSAFIEPLVISGSQWTGICWYKKVFRAEKRQRHRHTGLLFDGAMNDAIIYLNGADIARHSGGYVPFYVNLTDDLDYGRENEIMVRLDNRENPDIPPGKALAELDFLWYSGLYRNVSLYITDKLHITSPPEVESVLGGGIITGSREISREAATVTVSVHVTNDDRIPRSFHMKNTLLDAAGLDIASSRSERIELEPGQSRRLMTKIIVMQPALWSHDQPFLYTLVTDLQSDKGVIDRRETRTGIRSVKITSDMGLILNGDPVMLTGTNRHQEYPYIGYALSDEASYRDAFKIREAGFNIVRCSHYPPSPAFLDACDETGLLVIDAIPGWQFMGDSLFVTASVRDTRLMCRR
ncbi:MAG: glycoside hydrolase family 2 protein, partial [Bacteroidales bacterium]